MLELITYKCLAQSLFPHATIQVDKILIGFLIVCPNTFCSSLWQKKLLNYGSVLRYRDIMHYNLY